MSQLLNVDQLKVTYNGNHEQIEVLHGVSVNVREGEIVGIVGESGSGKSQTALSVMRLLQGKPGITDGKIMFNGTEITSLSEKEMCQIRGHSVAIIFQDARASLIPYLTIRQQVMDTYKSLAVGRTKKEFLTRAKELLEEMNFSDMERVLSSYPGQLSGGECQRAYIMLSLLGNPKLLIADEPTSSLDPVTSVIIIDLLKKICTKQGISLILISHDLSEVVRIANFIYVFFNGYIVEQFPSAWLESGEMRPLHPYTRFLFSMFKGEAFADLKKSGKNENPDFISDSYSQAKSLTGGCIYGQRCKFQNMLNSEQKQLCQSRHPDLVEWKSEAKVACWGAQEMVNSDD